MSAIPQNASVNPARLRVTRPTFLFVCITMLLCAIALNAVVSQMRLYFKKQPVPQPTGHEFKSMPSVMGNWVQISADDKLEHGMEDVLGTNKYLYRDYLEVDRAGADLLLYIKNRDNKNTALSLEQSEGDDQANAAIRAEFNGADFNKRVKMIQKALDGKAVTERKSITSTIQFRHPESVVNVGLTYYTGLVDTVAHIPDRCYIADGYESTTYITPTWDLGTDAAGKPHSVQVRFISFEDQTERNAVPKCVAYVFHTNGHYECSPLGVRQTLQNLTQRYGYYSKIEMMTLGKDIDKAQQAMTEFLSVARPEIEKCLPDWNKVTASVQ